MLGDQSSNRLVATGGDLRPKRRREANKAAKPPAAPARANRIRDVTGAF